MTIGELANATGWSVHTIRYYDDSGLIPRVERNEAGRRCFTEKHVMWLGLLSRLRASGMSIARMREYAELTDRGDSTHPQRKALLRKQEADIRSRIAELEHCLKIVRTKIDLYEGRLSDRKVLWDLVAETEPGVRTLQNGFVSR